jgi:glycosyltransferase involved in cell wall biosynthesis
MHNKKTEILGIINGYPSSKFKGRLSGGTTHFIQLIKTLSRNRLNRTTVCLSFNSFEHYFGKNINIISLRDGISDLFTNTQIKTIFLIVVYLYRVLLAFFQLHGKKFDIVIASSHFFYDTFPCLFIKNRKATVVYIYHLISEQDRSGLTSQLSKLFEKISLYLIKRYKFIVITDSPLVTEQLILKYKFNHERVYTSKNGIKLEKISFVKGGNNKYDLVYCGRLTKSKGIYDLIEIVEKLKEDYPKIKSVVMGSGYDYEVQNIQNQIRNKRLQANIILRGFIFGTKKYQIIKNSTVFAFPSHEEGWGIVIGEALACGIPVVVYRLPEIVGIWKDKVAWVDCFNINQFVNTVKSLLENPQKRKSMIKRGYENIKDLDWKIVLDKEINYINKCVKNEI